MLTLLHPHCQVSQVPLGVAAASPSSGPQDSRRSAPASLNRGSKPLIGQHSMGFPANSMGTPPEDIYDIYDIYGFVVEKRTTRQQVVTLWRLNLPNFCLDKKSHLEDFGLASSSCPQPLERRDTGGGGGWELLGAMASEVVPDVVHKNSLPTGLNHHAMNR